MTQTILERNLLALSSHNTKLSFDVSHAQSGSAVTFVESKTGLPVPTLAYKDRRLPLHSTFDPLKEGFRFSQNYPAGGYTVFLGFGGGYHILPFLERKDISNVVIIDKDIGLFKGVLERIDLRSCILDRRVTFLIDYTQKAIEEFILSNYFPAVHGDLQILSLRSRIQTEEAYFQKVMDTLRVSIGTLSDDYTVQAHFGKKWFKNSLVNLGAAQQASTTLSPVRKALVTGAGPSLELQIPRLKEERASASLIATDTSLPSLLQYDIVPDLVISIDCQHISYHHFLSGYPKEVPLVLDLASPPDLTRLSDNLVFFTSAHPFSLYVNAHWRKFPFIDTSGGNVSHAAVSLANSLGAREILLFGADFSYPEGKSYARGTYIYPYFRSRELRCSPLESQFFSFLLRNQNIFKEHAGSFIRYTTRPMSSYKERLESAVREFSGTLHQIPGRGIELNLSKGKNEEKGKSAFPLLFAAGSPKSDWKQFLIEYNDALEKLEEPTEPFTTHFHRLPPKERDIWTTLFPAAAAFRQENTGRSLNGIDVLKGVKSWTRGLIGNYL